MKTNLLFPFLLLCAALLSACNHHDGDWGAKVRGTGPTVTETRTLNAIGRVELKIDAELIVTEGPTQAVRIEAQRNILDVLETEMSGDKLEIEFGRYNVKSHDPIKIYLTVPALTEVEVNGSGKARSATPLTARSFQVRVNGSGDADFNFAQAESVRSYISGSGEIRLNGTAQSHNVNISGSGKVSAYDFGTLDTYVSISGSGKSYLRASRTLNVDISGSGTVYYRGNPQVTSRISGSGKVLTGN